MSWALGVRAADSVVQVTVEPAAALPTTNTHLAVANEAVPAVVNVMVLLLSAALQLQVRTLRSY
jgi:hypothetical protein